MRIIRLSSNDKCPWCGKDDYYSMHGHIQECEKLKIAKEALLEKHKHSGKWPHNATALICDCAVYSNSKCSYQRCENGLYIFSQGFLDSMTEGLNRCMPDYMRFG